MHLPGCLLTSGARVDDVRLSHHELQPMGFETLEGEHLRPCFDADTLVLVHPW